MDDILSVEPTIPAATPAPETEPSGWMSPDGEIRDGAPESIQGLLEKKKWTNVNQIVDAYQELEKFKGGGEHLRIPEADDDDGWQEVYKLMGRPDDPNDYEISYEGDIPLDDDLVTNFKKFGHGLGLSQKQINQLVGFQIDAVKLQNDAYEAQTASQQEANVQQLKALWGEANFQSKISEARGIADKLGIYATLESKGLASDPDIIQMLSTIASRASEDTLTTQTPTPPAKAPSEELEEIKKSEAFTSRFHPKHKETMARYMNLCQTIANTRR